MHYVHSFTINLLCWG